MINDRRRRVGGEEGRGDGVRRFAVVVGFFRSEANGWNDGRLPAAPPVTTCDNGRGRHRRALCAGHRYVGNDVASAKTFHMEIDGTRDCPDEACPLRRLRRHRVTDTPREDACEKKWKKKNTLNKQTRETTVQTRLIFFFFFFSTPFSDPCQNLGILIDSPRSIGSFFRRTRRRRPKRARVFSHKYTCYSSRFLEYLYYTRKTLK